MEDKHLADRFFGFVCLLDLGELLDLVLSETGVPLANDTLDGGELSYLFCATHTEIGSELNRW